MGHVEDQVGDRALSVFVSEPTDEVRGLCIGDSGANRISRKPTGQTLKRHEGVGRDPLGEGVRGLGTDLPRPHLGQTLLEPARGDVWGECSAQQDVDELVAEDLLDGLGRSASDAR